MFRFLTAGESHGKQLTAIIEGVPAGFAVAAAPIDMDLHRRQGGYGRGGRMKIEQDRVQLLSGIRNGRSLGSPITLAIENKDWVNWTERMSVEPFTTEVKRVTRPRPGHGDLAGAIKYGHDDIRNVLERASARETTSRVAVGGLAKQLLAPFGIAIHSQVLQIGPVQIEPPTEPDWEAIERSPVRTVAGEAEMIAAIDAARSAGDTVGGVFEVVALGLPVGLGTHVHWDRRLDGRIAAAMMSIPSAKAVAIGEGFALAGRPGSDVHDVIRYGPESGWERPTNRAGGIEGGITNGQPVRVRVAVKPISTLMAPLESADLETHESAPATVERSDYCIVPAAGVVGEAMLALVLVEAFLEKFGGDSRAEVERNYQAYQRTYQPDQAGG